ncbi:SDR family NAD(P)-dependent oxidoreductase [Dongia sedimenti]|uniref:Glucose 1-dehydrogenase n=1 Tax=Dongia sedimenti TaxID=3064282 RepID=A0ABU0YNM8_9PROT|nr:glucose 1-dehydrogenase [Rhodospirillaceae bacterium R-7]
MTTALDQLFGLKGKVAVVTGGASGIGLASVELLAAAGAAVAVVDRDAEAARQALAKIGGNGIALGTDVALESEIEEAASDTLRALGRIDILVNSAGTAIRRPAVEVTVEDWDKVMAVNMTGTFLFSRAVARSMIEKGEGGSIVQVASIMGLSGGGLYPNISYQTSKGAVVNMTRALAVEWAPHQIRVNAVAPTYVKTPFIAGLMAQPELVKRIEAMTPMARLAEPAEIASAVLFLASPGAAMVTGHTLFVDGGFLAQ